MPIKGIILIAVVAVALAFHLRNEIYEVWEKYKNLGKESEEEDKEN